MSGTRIDLVPSDWIETSPRNHYGDKVVANVIRRVECGSVRFRCKDDRWDIAFAAWCKSRRDNRADESVPELPCPESEGHCMFLTPEHYGCVAIDETRPSAIRRALRHSVVAVLDGWDREMRKTPAGMRRLAAIVRATVTAKLAGHDPGASPFVACVASFL